MDILVNGRKNCYGITVTTQATELNTNDKRVGLAIRNNDSTNTVYLGGTSAVTSSNGFPLLAGEVIQDLDAYDRNRGGVDTWYAITASGTINVRCIEYLA